MGKRADTLAIENKKLTEQNTTLKDRNNELEIAIGDNTDWKTVKAIPWLNKYFKQIDSEVYRRIGIHLSNLSRINRIEIKKVQSTEWGTVNAYHIKIIEEFRIKLAYDSSILQEYRRKPKRRKIEDTENRQNNIE